MTWFGGWTLGQPNDGLLWKVVISIGEESIVSLVDRNKLSDTKEREPSLSPILLRCDTQLMQCGIAYYLLSARAESILTSRLTATTAKYCYSQLLEVNLFSGNNLSGNKESMDNSRTSYKWRYYIEIRCESWCPKQNLVTKHSCNQYSAPLICQMFPFDFLIRQGAILAYPFFTTVFSISSSYHISSCISLLHESIYFTIVLTSFRY